MYKQNFGTINQIRFSSENDYYETFGFLAKSTNDVAIRWKRNKNRGIFYTLISFMVAVVNFIGLGPQIEGKE